MVHLMLYQGYQRLICRALVIVFLFSCLRTPLTNYFPSQARFGCLVIGPVLFILHLVICINSIHYGLDPVFFFLITSSLQVVALDVDLPVKQAFHILHEQVHTKEKTFLYY